jgi:hypothetical protein
MSAAKEAIEHDGLMIRSFPAVKSSKLSELRSQLDDAHRYRHFWLGRIGVGRGRDREAARRMLGIADHHVCFVELQITRQMSRESSDDCMHA